MNVTTTVDGTKLSIAADLTAILKDKDQARFLIGRGIRTLTYDAKDSLIVLRNEKTGERPTNEKTEAFRLWKHESDALNDRNIELSVLSALASSSAAVPTPWIDKAADKLRNAGIEIEARPAYRVKGQPGEGVKPTDWAMAIKIEEPVKTKLAGLAKKWKFPFDAPVTLANYAVLLKWKRDKDDAENDADLADLAESNS